MESRKQRSALDTVICSSFLLNNLPDDLLQVCLSFVGPGQYRLVAGTCNRLRELYGGMFPKRTTWESAAGSVLCAALCMHETSDAAEPPSPLKDQILRALTNKAALTGKLAVLQWAIDDHSYAVGKWCFFHAGKCGQGNILEWGEANGMDWFSDDLCNAVMRNGHVGVLDWIYRHHPVELSLTYAARGGHIPVLNWMKQHELMGEVKPAMWYYAAERGHLHVLEWLLEN